MTDGFDHLAAWVRVQLDVDAWGGWRTRRAAARIRVALDHAERDVNRHRDAQATDPDAAATVAVLEAAAASETALRRLVAERYEGRTGYRQQWRP